MGRITKPREYRRCKSSSDLAQKLSRHIGEALLTMRQEHAVTMRDVADGAGMSNAFVCQVENGQSLPSAETLWKLSQFFDVSTSYWFEGFEDHE